MTAKNDNMVLRTVYLPLDIDRRLKKLAYAMDETKNELIRRLILQGIESLESQARREVEADILVAVPAAKPSIRKTSVKVPARQTVESHELTLAG